MIDRKSDELLSFPDNALAVVSGGSRGIGRAVALRLARCGFDICFNYRENHVEAEATVRGVEALGRECRALCFDVRDRDAVEANLVPLVEERGAHVLVNNAGITCDTVFPWMTFEEWDEVTRTTLDGFFNLTKAVLPAMLRLRRGRIVNVASVSGQAGRVGQVNYAAAKAGLIGATKALAAEVARKGVLVNAVAPGLIATDMTKDLPAAEILRGIPLKRFGDVEEVAGVIAFLCSRDASYITGQVIGVSGGLYR
ncbi:MAG: 3-oxoacyl-ACP reductase FabG [Acidobacteriota bacterium]|nr:3-oxoacyl-ACP reductase FabG [Acidobacteriota bacterium]